MQVILGEQVADDWWEYDSGSKNVRKLWECPRCHEIFAFIFNDDAPWPPLTLKCPDCAEESPIPWRTPAIVTWKCERCGTTQTVSQRAWVSRGKIKPVTGGSMLYFEEYIRCRICCDLPSSDFGPPVTLGTVARGIVYGALGAACDLIGTLIGGPTAHDTEEWERQRKEIEKATKKFNRFLKKVPQLRAEQERLAEEERQKAALEAKKRQEELRLLRKQSTTAAGLKRMKPTNFELAVASLYLKLGYNVYMTPTSSDRGIDLVAIKDKERIALQCKKYKRTVPVSQVRDFYGSFVGTYSRGVFVTSSAFSKSTREWAEKRQGLELVNGQQLAKLFVEHNPKIVGNVEKWKERS